jgi:hypothetical protein
MKLFYQFTLLVIFILQYNCVLADEGSLKIEYDQEIYALPRLWYFVPEDNMRYTDIRKFPPNASFLSPYETWTSTEEYKDYTGNALFGLKIIIQKTHSDYALILRIQSKGTQVFWNGILLYETRPFDVNGKTPDIQGAPAIIFVPKNVMCNGENSLVLRVGCLNDRGRLMYPIVFGKNYSIQNAWVNFIIWNSLLFSISIFIFIYFIFIYYKRRKEKYYL